jgi:hypothetical protein
MVNFNSEHKKVIDDMLLVHPNIRPGKMFGLPAYYVGKKLCICLYEDGVGVKIPEETAKKLLETDPNVAPFVPFGKSKMREWIQLKLSRSEDYRQYITLFDDSIRYLLAKQ